MPLSIFENPSSSEVKFPTAKTTARMIEKANPVSSKPEIVKKKIIILMYPIILNISINQYFQFCITSLKTLKRHVANVNCKTHHKIKKTD